MSIRTLSYRFLVCSVLLSALQVCCGQTSPQGSATPNQSPTPPQAASQTGSTPGSTTASTSAATSPTANPSPTPCPLSASETGLIACPATLTFEAIVGETSAAQRVVLTNKSTATLNLNYSVAPGDFKADGDCRQLIVNASCAISITFTPAHAEDTKGSLTINFSPADATNPAKVLLLDGTGLQHCKTFDFSWNYGVILLFVVAGLYFLGLLLVRWHMLVQPDWTELVARIRSVRSWVEAEAPPLSPDRVERVRQITQLLDSAALPFNSRKIRVPSPNAGLLPWTTRLFNALFWSRGIEVASWNCIHTAEQQLVALLPEPRVRAWMEEAEAKLRQFKTDEADAIANQIHTVLQPGAKSTFEDRKALLIEALILIHKRTDDEYEQAELWHRKMLWLVSCALLFILAIGVTFQNAVLMLAGAVGGLLSRLMQNLKAAQSSGSDDYGATWGALFLSPLTGALASWGGILLMILAAKLKILGAALEFDWCNPYQPVTLAVALLLGFTERLFDDLATQVTPKLLPSPSSPKGVPTISSIDPSTVIAGQPDKVVVRGANFQSGIAANLTDNDGQPVAATAEYRDATTLNVTFTAPPPPPGIDHYSSTLTVTNPDKQIATFQFKVIPSQKDRVD